MKRIRLSRNNKLICPRTSDSIDVKECLACDDLFGIVRYSHVNCKRGIVQDTYLKRRTKK